MRVKVCRIWGRQLMLQNKKVSKQQQKKLITILFSICKAGVTVKKWWHKHQALLAKTRRMKKQNLTKNKVWRKTKSLTKWASKNPPKIQNGCQSVSVFCHRSFHLFGFFVSSATKMELGRSNSVKKWTEYYNNTQA